MGLLSSFRTLTIKSAAVGRVDWYLRAEYEAGRLGGNPRQLAEALVSALWVQLPALSGDQGKPSAILVAAASLAAGVQQADRNGSTALSTALFSALKMLLAVESRTVDVERLSAVDGELFDFAHSVFDSTPSADAAALREIMNRAIQPTGF